MNISINSRKCLQCKAFQKMKKIIVIIVCVFLFINCSNSTSNEKKSSADSTLSSAINTSANYNNWQSAKGEKIEFKYPQDWRLKIRKTKGTTQFGLTNDADTSDIFFPIEIWEFDPAGHKFEEFSGVPHQY